MNDLNKVPLKEEGTPNHMYDVRTCTKMFSLKQ